MKATLENKILKEKEKWRKIGIVGVDSGCLMVGDPCYLTDKGWTQKELSAVDIYKKTTQLKFEKGHAGKGVIFHAGIGDGCYDVFAKFEDLEDWGERITEVRIVMWTTKEKKFGEALMKEQRIT